MLWILDHFDKGIFERRLATSFGRDNVWLAGDSGHVTGPVGVQSMNVGLREADEVATMIDRIRSCAAMPEIVETYNRERRKEWRALLGLEGARRWCQSFARSARRSGLGLPLPPLKLLLAAATRQEREVAAFELRQLHLRAAYLTVACG